MVRLSVVKPKATLKFKKRLKLLNHKVFLKINFLKKKFQKQFKYWSELSINFQFQSFHRVYDQNWLNSKFCGGGPQVEPKPTSSDKNLLILWNTTLPIAAQLMSRHCKIFRSASVNEDVKFQTKFNKIAISNNLILTTFSLCVNKMFKFGSPISILNF